jgi:hypothetical protein
MAFRRDRYATPTIDRSGDSDGGDVYAPASAASRARTARAITTSS